MRRHKYRDPMPPWIIYSGLSVLAVAAVVMVVLAVMKDGVAGG